MLVEKPKKDRLTKLVAGTRKQAVATGRMSAAKRDKPVSLAPVNLPREREETP
jgi:hypothetical protein